MLTKICFKLSENLQTRCRTHAVLPLFNDVNAVYNLYVYIYTHIYVYVFLLCCRLATSKDSQRGKGSFQCPLCTFCQTSKNKPTNPKLEHCTFFMRDGLFSKSERCCLPVILCTTVYIAAVTKLRIHLSFTSWGWIICIVNILCYSAFASIMVALEPGTPYWVRWSHPRHLALTSLSMLFQIHMNCQLSKRGWSPSTMSLYRNDCS